MKCSRPSVISLFVEVQANLNSLSVTLKYIEMDSNSLLFFETNQAGKLPNSLFDYDAKVSTVLSIAYSTSKRIIGFEFEGKISKSVV